MREQTFKASPLLLIYCSALLLAAAGLLRPAAVSADPGAVSFVAPMEEQVDRTPQKKKKKKKKKKAAVPPAPAEAGTGEAAAKAEVKPAETKDVKPKDTPYSGIFYGEIASVDIDRSTIFVEPLDLQFSRKLFYFDKTTQYFVDLEPEDLASLHIGQKVAIRFFGEQTLRIADAVYVVKGEFKPDDYKAVKKKGKDKNSKKKAQAKAKAKSKPVPAADGEELEIQDSSHD